MKPIEGASSEGAKGIAKGVAKGITGVIFKPAVATVDFVTKTGEGIKNSASYRSKRVRTRPARWFPESGVLKVFDDGMSIAQALLWRVDKSKYRHHDLVGCAQSSAGSLLVSNLAIIMCEPERLALVWYLPWEFVVAVSREAQCARVHLSQGVRDSKALRRSDFRDIQPVGCDVDDVVRLLQTALTRLQLRTMG